MDDGRDTDHPIVVDDETRTQTGREVLNLLLGIITQKFTPYIGTDVLKFLFLAKFARVAVEKQSLLLYHSCNLSEARPRRLKQKPRLRTMGSLSEERLKQKPRLRTMGIREAEATDTTDATDATADAKSKVQRQAYYSHVREMSNLGKMIHSMPPHEEDHIHTLPVMENYVVR